MIFKKIKKEIITLLKTEKGNISKKNIILGSTISSIFLTDDIFASSAHGSSAISFNAEELTKDFINEQNNLVLCDYTNFQRDFDEADSHASAHANRRFHNNCTSDHGNVDLQSDINCFTHTDSINHEIQNDDKLSLTHTHSYNSESKRITFNKEIWDSRFC